MELYALSVTLICIFSLFYILFLHRINTKRRNMGTQLENLLKLRESALQINELIANTSDTDVMYDAILTKTLEMIKGANFGSILILKEDGFVYPVAYQGFDHQLMTHFRLRLEDTFVYRVHAGDFKKTTIINNLADSDIFDPTGLDQSSNTFKIQSVLTAPIYIGDKLHGMINVDSNQSHVFTPEDAQMLEYFRKQVEITLSKQLLYNEVLYLSRYDSLTGVYNRRYFDEIVASYIKKSNRYGETFVLVVFDIDGLKYVNDNYGHLAGDILIRTLSDTLYHSKRDSDLFARFGGDEFIAVYFNTTAEQIDNKIRLLREHLAQKPIKYDDHEFYCHFSFGSATFLAETFNFDELKIMADARMYEEKRQRHGSDCKYNRSYGT